MEVSIAGEVEVEEIGDLIVNRQKLLDLSRQFEPFHHPLSSPRRLMGIFRPVVQALVLAMFDPKAHVFARRAVRFEFVGDHDAWRSLGLLQQLPHEPPRGGPISSVLHEDVENEAALIDGPPKPMLSAADRNDDLVEMPFIAANRSAAINAIGEFPAEFLGPATNAFMADVNAACGEHFLDHAQAQRKPEIEPDRTTNDFGREAMATIKWIMGLFHDPI